MKTSIKNIRNFTGSIVEIITPNNSPFVVTVFENGVTINFGEQRLAQKHVQHFEPNNEAGYRTAIHSAYREAMLALALNDPFNLQALYRHIIRAESEGLRQPEILNSHQEYVAAILELTPEANDVAVAVTGDTDFDGKTQSTIDLCLVHDGAINSHDATRFQIEMLRELTGIRILGEAA